MSAPMEGVILWVVVLGALLVVGLITARRMNTLAARTRSLDGFQEAVIALDVRLGEAADPLVARLDEIRRRSGDPQTMSAELPALQETLHDLAAEGHALQPPPPLVAQASSLVMELERAVRAADLIEHGLDALLAHRGGRDLEAQTSLKRGALNLRHAREATARIAKEVAAARPTDLATSGRGASRGAPPAVIPTSFGDGERDGERV